MKWVKIWHLRMKKEQTIIDYSISYDSGKKQLWIILCSIKIVNIGILIITRKNYLSIIFKSITYK